MKKNIRISEPSEEMMEKIRKARHAIANQKTRMVKCPFCGHNSIAVSEAMGVTHHVTKQANAFATKLGDPYFCGINAYSF